MHDHRMYGEDAQYDEIRMRHPQSNGTGQHYVRNHMTYTEDPDHDLAMEELLEQLPSRQLESVSDLASRTLKGKRMSSRRGNIRLNTSDQLEDQMVETLQQDIDSTEYYVDDIDKAVRTIPTTLSKKRNIKRRLSSRKRGKLTTGKRIKYWFGVNWQRLKHKMRKVSRLFDLWRSHLMTIEGYFGTSVVSYFIFLKWVLLINIPLFLVTFCFLVIPQILYRYYQKVPPGYSDNTEDFTGIELLTGAGFFENSEMYYGFYTNETVEVFADQKYKMKYAYLFTCGGYYLFCLFILGYSYLHSYRKYYIEASGAVSLDFFSLVVCGWDYGIISQEASQLKQRSIYNELKEYLAGGHSVKPVRSRDELAKKWLLRVLAWIVVLILLGASGYATYIVSTELSIKPKLDNTTSIPVVSTLAMPVVISTIQLFVPMFFTFLEAYEQYSNPKYELYVHMFREMALKAGMLGVLVFFWFDTAATQVKCWETFVGEEIYRLVIVDLIFTLGYSFFMEFVRKLCALRWKIIERPEFAIGRHTLELVYSQSLCWLGVFYAPLLPVVVILKLIIIFYVKRISVVQNCRPSLKPWRASRTHTIFVGYLFGFFILTCVAVGCSIFLIKPSTTCGPYKFYETSYDVINNLIDSWREEHEIIEELFDFIKSPGFIVGLLVFLSMALYYMRTIMKTHQKMVGQFKLQLAMEGKDKKFLINLLNQVKVKGQGVNHHPGPTLHKTMESYSSSPNLREAGNLDGNKVFVRTIAESALSSTPTK